MRRSGIYSIINMTNGKRYIGQSVSIDTRILKHMNHLFKGTHANKYLQSAFNFYGCTAFIAEIVEFCSHDILTEREQYWIDFYGFENLYNICPSSESPRGVKRSDEFKRKLSNSLKGKPPTDEWRKLMSESNKGRVFSEEHRHKISESGKNHAVSEETKQKISKSLTGRKMSSEAVRKSSESRKGKKRTPEQRQRMSEGRKRRKEERNAKQNGSYQE